MRKEVLWAVAAGIILGLIVAFGVWRVNSTISGKKGNGISTASPTPQAENANESKIVLDKPEQGDVVTNNTVTVAGLTKALSWVTLSGESGDYTVQSDTSGAFTQDVNLIPGVNQIKVTAFFPAVNSGSKLPGATEVLVVYSSSFQTRTLPISSPKGDASGTSEIRQKVAQDVANILSQPKAYIGTVTDITDSTVQIKTTTSEINQVSISADATTVINSTGTTSKTVKTTDIAIGDFIVAMGYIDENSVLSAQRILITDPITEPKITISEAKVASATKKVLTVNTISDNTEVSVQPNTKTDIEAVKDGKSVSAKFSSISVGDVIIYVVTMDDKGATSVRSIFQTNSSQG
jgi:hypothetical protein